MGGAGGVGSNDRIALDRAGKSQGVFSGTLIWSADRNYCGGELVLTRSTYHLRVQQMSTADHVHQSSTNTTRAPANRPSAGNSTTLIERHKISSGYMRDAIIGLADGLTVPFALTAGLSS